MGSERDFLAYNQTLTEKVLSRRSAGRLGVCAEGSWGCHSPGPEEGETDEMHTLAGELQVTEGRSVSKAFRNNEESRFKTPESRSWCPENAGQVRTSQLFPPLPLL